MCSFTRNHTVVLKIWFVGSKSLPFTDSNLAPRYSHWLPSFDLWKLMPAMHHVCQQSLFPLDNNPFWAFTCLLDIYAEMQITEILVTAASSILNQMWPEVHCPPRHGAFWVSLPADHLGCCLTNTIFHDVCGSVLGQFRYCNAVGELVSQTEPWRESCFSSWA